MNKKVSISDKYTQTEGRVFLNGNQAIVKALLMRQQADADMGWNTRGYVSGYRGSPLGGLDTEIARARKFLEPVGVDLHPGVNEELAATSILGTQQIEAYEGPTVDGVFSLWYGKGPGVDRAADALRHGNSAGSHPKGGVVVAYGDDHPGKSSTVAHQSEQTLAALSVPSLYPANAGEIIEYAMLGWDMSRYTGLWVGLKCVNETVEQTTSAQLPALAAEDQGGSPDDGIHIQPRFFNPKVSDQILTRDRLPKVGEFVRKHQLNKVTFGAAQPRIGILTAGKAYADVIEALSLLGITHELAEASGIGVFKVGCIWPLEPQGLEQFAAQAELLFCAEEKRPFLEQQAKDILFNLPSRPQILGKLDAEGKTLLPSDIQLDGEMVARALQPLLKASLPELRTCPLSAGELSLIAVDKPNIRAPYFCSGCPHNTSTKLPEGSLGLSGIGCHGMISAHRTDLYMPPTTQMGGEGLAWVGAQAYTSTKHVFQNLGDGTYFHSGILAIRAAISAKARITYKILYNDAVAMTGGQPIDGQLPIPMLLEQVQSEGIAAVVIVTDDKAKYENAPANVRKVLRHRSEMDQIQKQFSQVDGVTVIIYEQTCAAEKRRRRKRGSMEDPEQRAFIYDPVCEGCGDCSKKSSCVSVLPKPTELGLKRKIDQDSCNKDFRCVEGFCPSFITVHSGKVARSGNRLSEFENHFADLPAPQVTASLDDCYSVLVTGIGGTGVVTVAAIVGMAAHIEEKYVSIFDMTGLAQKNGAVFSHIRLAADAQQLTTARIGPGRSDLIMAFDLLSLTNDDVRFSIDKQRTHLIGNGNIQPTAYFALSPSQDALPNEGALGEFVADRFNAEQVHTVKAQELALDILGTSMGTNMFLLGVCYQKGRVPLSAEAIEEAITLNGTAVDMNIAAFRLGRLNAHRPELFESQQPKVVERLNHDARVAFLADYQNDAWADQYREQVADFLRQLTNNPSLSVEQRDELLESASWQLFRLMSYKDEYEVARLYTSPRFRDELTRQFGDKVAFSFNLAPPMLKPWLGEDGKIRLGSWLMSAFGLLARMKGLRGSALDLFGYTTERKMERRWIRDYPQVVASALAGASADNLKEVKALLDTADQVRGYGHIKINNMKQADQRFAELREQLAL